MAIWTYPNVWASSLDKDCIMPLATLGAGEKEMANLKLDWIDVASLRDKRRKKGSDVKSTVVVMRHPDLTKEKYLVRIRYDDPRHKNFTAERTNSFDRAMAYAINLITHGYRPMNEVEIKYV